jgi:phosphatidylglycerol lysyltransferase
MIALLQKWRRFLPYLGGIAALLLFAAALFVLHRHAQAYRPSEVRSALRTLQIWQPFAALGLAAASYWLLTLYDVMALRHVGRTLPYGGVALASCTAYAFSHAVGFGSIIGPSIRYRVYTPMGLTAGEIAETSGFVIVTFMTGLVAVFPIIALLDPSSLETLGVSRFAGIAVGILGLVLMAGYIGLGWWMDRPIRLFGHPFHLPRPRTAVAQVVLSVADLSLVAAVLYACLPHASEVGYPHVLAVYVLAFVAGLISHVPGGLGVFDAMILVGLSPRLSADQILAGLLVFRVVYQLVPLVCAGAVFGAVEVLTARRWFVQRVEDIGIWAGAVGPAVLAGCVFMGGVTLLFSNAMPVSSARLRLVETLLPLDVIEISHLVGSIDGVLMLVLAYALQQRSRSAWAMSAVLLWVGAVSLMLKGFAWEEASVLALLLLVLLPAGREFQRESSLPPQEYAFGLVVAIGVVLATASWLGLFSYKHLDDAEWWRFRLHDNASRFVRASIAVAVVALGAAAYRFLKGMRYRRGAIRP